MQCSHFCSSRIKSQECASWETSQCPLPVEHVLFTTFSRAARDLHVCPLHRQPRDIPQGAPCTMSQEMAILRHSRLAGRLLHDPSWVLELNPTTN